MKQLRLAAIVVVALLVGGGAQVALGQTFDSNPKSSPQPPTASTNALGNGVTEAKYVGITPCRIVDTRQAGGPLAVGAARGFKVRGTGSEFAANQGGKANGCGIPATATAIETTVTSVGANSGFLRVWPSGQSQPNATFMNYGGSVNLSNTGTLTLCASGCGIDHLTARAYGNATELVVDVQGYYAQPMAAHIKGSDGSVFAGARTTGSTRFPSPGQYSVTFDRSVDGCVVTGSPDWSSGLTSDERTIEAHISSGIVFVELYDAAGTHADYDFSVLVTC